MKKVGYIILAIFVAACSGGTFQTEGGTTVTYVEKGEGDLPADSLVSIFYMSYETEDGKELMKADPNNPIPLKINKENASTQGELFKILTQLRTGDSVGFDLVAKELFENTFRAPLPDSIPEDSKIRFQIAYIDQLTETGYYEMMQKKADEFAKKQIVIDSELLDNYLAENNVEATTTESGLRYVITEQGDGPKPEQGATVSVNYAGWVMSGEYFDTSIKEVAEEQGIFNPGRTYQPYQFPLGKGQVIRGWDEGIALLNEGTKARLYIPSSLGYGTRSSGPVIKANSILIFDVELVEVAQ